MQQFFLVQRIQFGPIALFAIKAIVGDFHTLWKIELGLQVSIYLVELDPVIQYPFHANGMAINRYCFSYSKPLTADKQTQPNTESWKQSG